jgi:two-component system response regulator YesN
MDVIRDSREKSIQQFTIASYIESAKERHEDLVTSLVGMQHEIIEKVVVGDLNGCREIINRFLGVIFLESGKSFDVLKVRLLELVIIISRAAVMRGIHGEALLGENYSYLTEINAATEFNDLFWKLTKVLENFTRTVSRELGRKARAHMSRMTAYIRKNFAAGIRAADVAAAAGISMGRALHLFTKECGMSLSAYVARERIEYAKYLLKNMDRSAGDIAAECGFFDQSHFTRTFRALEKTSPLKFRKNLEG